MLLDDFKVFEAKYAELTPIEIAKQCLDAARNPLGATRLNAYALLGKVFTERGRIVKDTSPEKVITRNLAFFKQALSVCVVPETDYYLYVEMGVELKAVETGEIEIAFAEGEANEPVSN